MPFRPLSRGVESFPAVGRQARADAAHHRRVYPNARNDRLAFRQSREFGEHCPARAFYRLYNGLLIDGIDDSHNDLRHTLRENVLIELSRPLGYQPDADAELPSLAQDLLKHVCRDNAGTRGSKTMCFLKQSENRIIEEILTRRRMSPNGLFTGFVNPSKQRTDYHLLKALLDVRKVEYRHAARSVKIAKLDMFVGVENTIGLIETRIEPPEKSLYR